MNFFTALYNIILSPISQIIEIAYILFDKLFDNTGIALIGVSMTVTLLCLPLYIVAESWQETERNIQLKMKKEILRIKTAFKGDEQYMILSTYYKQNHYHPIMALRSSFGILIQIPFFFAAYHILSSLPDLHGREFLFIKDMGKPDAIFSINGFAINILPVIMTMINCISGTIYSKGHEIREKIQIYGMACLFLIILYNSPAGLVFYWTMNNIFSLVKNVFYKMKNPLKTLYYFMAALILFVSLYILIIFDRGSFSIRLAAALTLLLLIPVPIYIKGINRLIKNSFSHIFNDSRKRLFLFFTSVIGLAVLCGLTLPSGLISSSVQEFSNIDTYGSPVVFLSSSFWVSFGLIIFWPSCVYFLFKEKVQTVLSFTYSVFFAASLINSFAFAGNYGSMDETLKLIDGFKNPPLLFIVINAFTILFTIILIIFFIRNKMTNIIISLYSAVVFGMVVMTVINVSGISTDYKEYEKTLATKKDTNPKQTKFHLSKDKENIMIFMLDRFASIFVQDILNDQSDIKENFSGFVYYPNCISFNSHTLMAANSIYGGYEYSPYEANKRKNLSIKEKLNEGILVLPKIFTEQAEFNVVLSDISWANSSYTSDMSFISYYDPEKKEIVDNYPNVRGINLLSKYTGEFKKEKLRPEYTEISLSHVIKRNLFWTSLFRVVPSFFRIAVYKNGTWWENGVQKTTSSFPDWFSALYYMEKITDFSSDKPTLSIITNECTHSNEDISMYNIPLNGKISNSLDPAYIIHTVTLKQISQFITFLKENNVYDNTRLILVSDHGIGYRGKNFTTEYIGGYSKDHLNPLLMVKDFNAKDEIKIDNKFMTNADVPFLATKGIIKNPVNPFTGNEISEKYKENGVKVTFEELFKTYHSKNQNYFTVPDNSWYTVKDNIFVDSNWTK